jgi:glycosyltransferase involved in cell wall biosynthesis
VHKSIGTIDVFAICYNEEVMLPHFIKHYKDMGANITIYDNFSTDKSREIIRKSGCNYMTYNSNNQIRDDLYLGIKNECWKKSKAQWVIVCDVDEFIEVSFDVSKYTIINTMGYDIIGLPPSRFGVRNPLYSKNIMFRPSQFRQIGFQAGCHVCKPEGMIAGSKELAPLLHYKYISEEYVYSRHLLYQSRLSDFNKQYNFGIEYQDVAEEKIIQKFASMRSKLEEVPDYENLQLKTGDK